jgi:hypothetical protein
LVVVAGLLVPLAARSAETLARPKVQLRVAR